MLINFCFVIYCGLFELFLLVLVKGSLYMTKLISLCCCLPVLLGGRPLLQKLLQLLQNTFLPATRAAPKVLWAFPPLDEV
uniref:Putative secreted protein n=1 Tax=Ixodes ricinus TaxID=34613 RepID=A0A6B0TVP6_IXORI